MALTKEDIASIEQVVDKSIQTAIKPIKDDVSSLKKDVSEIRKDLGTVKSDIIQMKGDLSLLARLNHLDEVRKSGRLMSIYGTETEKFKQ